MASNRVAAWQCHLHRATVARHPASTRAWKWTADPSPSVNRREAEHRRRRRPKLIQETIAEADALIGDLVIPPVGDGYLRPRDAAPLAGILVISTKAACALQRAISSPEPTATPWHHVGVLTRHQDRTDK